MHDSFPDHRFHRTLFITVSTVQTVLLPDDKRFSFLNTFLWTMFHTCPASDTGFCYVISLFFYTDISQNIGLPENWIYAKIKIFHFRLINAENNPDFSCISRMIKGFPFSIHFCGQCFIHVPHPIQDSVM